ncbi:hypothetical protein CBI30_03325 [Polynucleobacter aenigmaticus]|uniref:Uncharacterized protein n=2 Tax=Polynucleobacter aenigmaticus TaxID=1743164 RepID=A0A254Q121_9BURK|nr:hypothetical protein CBI30_03325 [Polynucleobacter aenigmaticus]
MSKVKIALISSSPKKPLPLAEDMRQKLNIKKVVVLNPNKKNPAWTQIEKDDTFVWDMKRTADEALKTNSQYMATLYAFSDDANSSMLGLMYGHCIEAYTTIDRDDIKECEDLARRCQMLQVMVRHLDNVVLYENFVDEINPTTTVIKKLEAMHKADEKNAKYFQLLKEKELEKLRKILTKGWD